jgi:uncharacterized membrane protein YtjA (UPF0391 family)
MAGAGGVFPLILQLGRSTMLRYALIFLVIALIAGALGLWGLEGVAMEGARILFFVFIILFVISLIMGRRSPLA